MTAPAQQKAPESLARLEGGVPASLTEKDNTIMSQPTDNVTTTADWKRDLVYSTPGVFRPADVLNMLRTVDSVEEASEMIARHVPIFVAPIDAPAPQWAARAADWSWVDGAWQRHVEIAFPVVFDRGFTIVALQTGDSDGVVSTTAPELEVNLPTDPIATTSGAARMAVLGEVAADWFRQAMEEWKDDLVGNTPGVTNAWETRERIRAVDDVDRVQEIVRQSIPVVALPEVDAPGWAEVIEDWSWIGGADQTWSRRCSRQIDVPDSDGQGIELFGYQYVGADGAVRTEAPVLAADVQIDEVSNVRELAAWFAAAAQTIEAAS